MSLLAIKTGQKTVATAGTQLQIATTKTLARNFVFVAPAANSGVVYLGDANVDSSTGFPVAAGAKVTALDLGLPADATIDLNQTWVDAATNGDKIAFMYFVPAAP
jgi:hypothetical protein